MADEKEKTESVPLDLQDVAFGSGVQQGFEVLPTGIYVGHIEDIKFAESSKKKTPQWSVKIRVDEGEYEKRIFFDNWYLTTGSLWKLQQHLEAITGEKFRDDGVDLNAVREDLIGHSVTVSLLEDEYEGKPKNTVDHYVPINETEGNEVPF